MASGVLCLVMGSTSVTLWAVFNTRSSLNLSAFFLTFAVLATACGGGKDDGNKPGVDAGDEKMDSGTGDPDTLIGGYQVRLVAPAPASGDTAAKAGYTTVLGTFFDGVQPAAVVWEVADAEGDCTLSKPRVPFCADGCGGDVCVEDDVCAQYPAAQTVGTVTVTGLLTDTEANTFTIDPVANNYQPSASLKLAYPPFAEGDDVEFAAAGSDFNGPFSVASRGIAELVLTSDDLTLNEGSPLALTWTPGADATAATIHVALDISHHGGSKGQIECDTTDSGSLTIPATLVTALLDLGVAGYPTVKVSRRATGSTTISAGRVDLVIYSQVEAAITIPGLVSCTDTEECPGEQTCQSDLTCG